MFEFSFFTLAWAEFFINLTIKKLPRFHLMSTMMYLKAHSIDGVQFKFSI